MLMFKSKETDPYKAAIDTAVNDILHGKYRAESENDMVFNLYALIRGSGKPLELISFVCNLPDVEEDDIRFAYFFSLKKKSQNKPEKFAAFINEDDKIDLVGFYTVHEKIKKESLEISEERKEAGDRRFESWQQSNP